MVGAGRFELRTLGESHGFGVPDHEGTLLLAPSKGRRNRRDIGLIPE